MELPYALFEVSLSDVPLCATGHDAVTFRFSSSGKNPVEVAKCASGGELSRIMLALKAMMARYANMPTMIFDEIDTGVSGSVADKMGSVICDMGNHMQVFAITHLPQVAAKGSAHYLVSKDIDPATGAAVSKIERLSDEQRVMELARMLSGSVLTDEAIANARALLGN
jgi:DNA repair protein RecN (Recombination protein N)